MIDLLSEVLLQLNPWWEEKPVPFIKGLPHRELFWSLQKTIFSEKRIQTIVGLRRVGKTTLLLQLISLLLDRKIERENILYLVGDDPNLMLYWQKDSLSTLLDFYLTNVAKRGKKFVFIDEAHFVPLWDKTLKSYYDRFSDLKFFITGSASLPLSKGSKESLVGRALEEILWQLSFREYLRFRATLKREVFPEDGLGENYNYQGLTKLLINNPLLAVQRTRMFKPVFEAFLLFGGLPEGIFEEDPILWQKKLSEDIIKRNIYYDLVRTFPIRNPEHLETMLYLIARNQSQMFSLNTFINYLPFGSKETVGKYLEFLKAAFLVGELRKFTKRAPAKLKKFFIRDSGILQMIGKKRRVGDANIGQVVEGVVAHEALSKFRDVFFFRDSRGREVDLVVEADKVLLPIEVKHTRVVKRDSLKPLYYFCKKYTIHHAVILTGGEIVEEEHEGIRLFFLPVWEWLWMKEPMANIRP